MCWFISLQRDILLELVWTDRECHNVCLVCLLSHMCPCYSNWPLNILLSTYFKHDMIIDKSHKYWYPRQEMHLLLEISIWSAAPTQSFFKSPIESHCHIIFAFLLCHYRLCQGCLSGTCTNNVLKPWHHFDTNFHFSIEAPSSSCFMASILLPKNSDISWEYSYGKIQKNRLVGC